MSLALHFLSEILCTSWANSEIHMTILFDPYTIYFSSWVGRKVILPRLLHPGGARGICAKVTYTPFRPGLQKNLPCASPVSFPLLCDTGVHVLRQAASPDRSPSH